MSTSLTNLNPAATSETHVYYDLQITNNDSTGTKPYVPLDFNEIRNSPVLLNPSEYFMSVVRFQVQTPTLPLMIPLVEVGQADPNKLVYSVTLTNTSGVNYYEAQEFIEFVPQDLSISVPAAPTLVQNVDSGYYNVYSYNHFIKMVNTTLSNCFDALNTLVVAGGDTLPTTRPPFLDWDDTTGIAILNADISGYNLGVGGPTNPIKIFFNSPLFTLFSSFEALYYGTAVTVGKNWQIEVYDKNETNTKAYTGYDALQMYQEYPTLGVLACPIESLVFSTGLIPVAPALIAAPRIYNTDNSQISTGNNSNFINMLTDFQVGLTKGSEYKPSVSYVPASEYRLIDLFGNMPLASIQLSVYWKDNYGNLRKFFLAPGCSANLKIMFRRKNFNITDPRFF